MKMLALQKRIRDVLYFKKRIKTEELSFLGGGGVSSNKYMKINSRPQVGTGLIKSAFSLYNYHDYY